MKPRHGSSVDIDHQPLAVHRRYPSLLCLFLFVTVLVAGCAPSANDDQGSSSRSGATSSTAGGAAQRTRRLILLTNGDDPFWDTMRQGMNKAAEDFKLADAGLAAVLDKGDFSEEAQINKLNQYATQNDIAAVAISSTAGDNTSIGDAMKKLRAKGIQVITIDSDMNDATTRFAYLGTNNVVGGRELGKAAKGVRGDGGKYATFVGLKSVNNAIERIGGFKEGAGAGFEEIDSLGDDGDESRAQENVRNVLKNNPETNTLVGIWAYNAHAIVEVVKEMQVRDKTTVVVFDAAPLALSDMEAGFIDAMIVQNPYQMGYLGTQLMKALVEDDGPTIASIYPDYDTAIKKFKTAGGDIYNTELRVLVPDSNSPLTPAMFDSGTKFFRYSEFRNWMKERSLTGS